MVPGGGGGVVLWGPGYNKLKNMEKIYDMIYKWYFKAKGKSPKHNSLGH